MRGFAIITITLLICVSGHYGFAQKMFKVNNASEADIKVFVEKYESQADLKVYPVEYASEATKDGLWFFTKYASEAKYKIYFVESESQADLKIFYEDYNSNAGWRDNSKSWILTKPAR